MDALVARCSRYSGFNLEWSMKGEVLTIEDKAKGGQSRLSVTPFLSGNALREVYGRLHHWAVTVEEQNLMLEAIKAAQPAV
jgi:hypothetical protein